MLLDKQVEGVDVRSSAGKTAEILAERSHSGLIARATRGIRSRHLWMSC